MRATITIDTDEMEPSVLRLLLSMLRSALIGFSAKMEVYDSDTGAEVKE